MLFGSANSTVGSSSRAWAAAVTEAPSGKLDEREALLAEPLHDAGAPCAERARPRGGRGARAELDDQLAGDEGLVDEAAAALQRRVADDGGLVGACTGRSQNQGAGDHQHRRPKETRPHRTRL